MVSLAPTAAHLQWLACGALMLLLLQPGDARAAPVSAGAPIVDSYEDGTKIQRPRPFKRSRVRDVLIEENGAKSLAAEGTPDDCSRFVVSEAQVRQYFARARTISQRAYSHELDWSPCVASGTLALADGRRAQWGVQQYGLGWLYIDQRRTYFHCRTCSLVNLAVTLTPK
jgi:hypothetical protein